MEASKQKTNALQPSPLPSQASQGIFASDGQAKRCARLNIGDGECGCVGRSRVEKKNTAAAVCAATNSIKG